MTLYSRWSGSVTGNAEIHPFGDETRFFRFVVEFGHRLPPFYEEKFPGPVSQSVKVYYDPIYYAGRDPEPDWMRAWRRDAVSIPICGCTNKTDPISYDAIGESGKEVLKLRSHCHNTGDPARESGIEYFLHTANRDPVTNHPATLSELRRCQSFQNTETPQDPPSTVAEVFESRFPLRDRSRSPRSRPRQKSRRKSRRRPTKSRRRRTKSRRRRTKTRTAQ